MGAERDARLPPPRPSLGQASPQEGDLLANAASSLGLKGGNLLAKKLAARFGLEEARIETNGGLEEASLVVGKYLSPRLYVTYGVGLFEPISTFRIRYLLAASGRSRPSRAKAPQPTSSTRWSGAREERPRCPSATRASLFRHRQRPGDRGEGRRASLPQRTCH